MIPPHPYYLSICFFLFAQMRRYLCIFLHPHFPYTKDSKQVCCVLVAICLCLHFAMCISQCILRITQNQRDFFFLQLHSTPLCDIVGDCSISSHPLSKALTAPVPDYLYRYACLANQLRKERQHLPLNKGQSCLLSVLKTQVPSLGSSSGLIACASVTWHSLPYGN